MISEFPLFVFTTFAGIAAGSYAVSLFFPVRRDGAGKPWAFPLLMLALLAIGLIGCLLHLQHPERFLNALFNPAAGITLEAYFSIALGVVLVADVLCCVLRGSCPKWLRAVGAAAALLLAFVMGYAYSISFGVTAWASPISVLLFLVGDVAMGAGLCAALSYGDGPSRALSLTVAVASAAESELPRRLLRARSRYSRRFLGLLLKRRSRTQLRPVNARQSLLPCALLAMRSMRRARFSS